MPPTASSGRVRRLDPETQAVHGLITCWSIRNGLWLPVSEGVEWDSQEAHPLCPSAELRGRTGGGERGSPNGTMGIGWFMEMGPLFRDQFYD